VLCILLLAGLEFLFSCFVAQSFVLVAPPSPVLSSECSSSLFASKKKKKKRPASNTSQGGGGGFGGAALEPCPCGSQETYAACCGKLHQDVNSYRMATAEQVVRARYSAYAKKQPDFLIASTHPMHKDFDTDLKRWKSTIKTNMYDNFDMPRCVIVEENYGPSNDTATVRFIAEMVLRETGETTSFMETSTFERAKTHGAWLYRNGTIEAAPGDVQDDDGTAVPKEDDGNESMEQKLANML